MRRSMGRRRAPYPAANATVESRMFDVALLGVAAAGFGFAGEHGALWLEKRVSIVFFLAKKNVTRMVLVAIFFYRFPTGGDALGVTKPPYHRHHTVANSST